MVRQTWRRWRSLSPGKLPCRSTIVAVALLGGLGLSSCRILPESSVSSALKPDPDFKLDSAAGIDHRPLQTLLREQQWQAADRETFRILLEMSDRTAEGWLDQASVAALDCTDLHTQAELWHYYSDGQFGFIRQQQIWEEVGGTLGRYSAETAEQFGDRVGWRSHDKWRSYDQLNFSNSARAGHLPATTGNGVSGGVWGGVPILTYRLKYCRMSDALARRQWVEADGETLKLLEHYYLVYDSTSPEPPSLPLGSITCDDLDAIDRLWSEASAGRFGLTVQKDLLYDTGNGSAEVDQERYAQFEKAVDWRNDPKDLTYREANLEAIPVGHYPYRLGHNYATFGSAFNNTWRLELNPDCGF